MCVVSGLARAGDGLSQRGGHNAGLGAEVGLDPRLKLQSQAGSAWGPWCGREEPAQATAPAAGREVQWSSLTPTWNHHPGRGLQSLGVGQGKGALASHLSLSQAQGTLEPTDILAEGA